MKSKRTQIFLLALYVVLLVLIGLFQPKEMNWTPTFSSADKIPYGNFILYNELKNLFPKSEVYKNEKPFYNFSNGDTKGTGSFIIVNNETKADELDVKNMTEFVREGNNIFISSTGLPVALEDSLGIKISENFDYGKALSGDSELLYKMNFTNENLKSSTGYGFKKEYMSCEILNADSTHKKTEDDSSQRVINHLPRIELGKDESGRINFAKIPFGNGSFFIHTFPFAFTNYHFLKGNDNEYIAKCFSYLPDEAIYWDEYYKPYKRMKAQTPLRFILSVPAYKWTYYLTIFSLLIYILFSIKREQRIIPIIEPFKNLSLEFARTIGSLYYQQQDHKDLAEKKMVYFLEKVRNNYFLPTNLTDENFQDKLSYKSNAGKKTVQQIFKIYFSEIREGKNVSEQSLIAFNAALEKFYHESGLTNK